MKDQQKIEDLFKKYNVSVDELEDIIQQSQNKQYGLVWEHHKEEIEKFINDVTLEENKDLSVYYGDEYIDNVLIEGDNLLSLSKLEQMNRKVDIIYIDPPYNTGNNFIYNDKRMNRNNTYKHSEWLSFMQKRLDIAYRLLNDDGVVFISIDDREQAQLKLLMNQIFGEENVEMMIWNTTAEGSSGSLKQVKRTRSIHEYICIGYKHKPDVIFNKIQEPNNKLEDELITANLAKTNSQKKNKKENIFDIIAPNGKVWTDEWKFKKEKIDKLLNDNMLYFGKYGNNKPRLIIPTGSDRVVHQTSILNVGSTTLGKKDLKNVLDVEFSYPKPISLIKRFLQLHPNKNATVLDFFAGSGTTGHAALELNREDGGHRQFILCTNNENNICRDVTYERLRRVINGYTTPKGKDVEGLSANLMYLTVDSKKQS